ARRRRGVGPPGFLPPRRRLAPGSAGGGRRPADALDLAVPRRLARQRVLAGVEQRELDARRTTVEHQHQVATGGIAVGGFGHARDSPGSGRDRRRWRRRRALPTTEAELKLIATAAIIGDSSRPVNGYSTPAAMGTPSAL